MRGARIGQKRETLLNRNVTTKLMEVLESPKGRLAQIELLVCLAAFLLLFLVVFGGYRRCCNNRKFQRILWAAYTLPPYVITYTVGLMNAAPNENELFPVWATFLIMLLGSADSISAYNLEDNKQWKRYSWQLLTKMMALALLVTLYAKASILMIAIGSLYFVVLVKVSERAWASEWASKSFPQLNTDLFAEYMKREQLKSNQDEVDLTTMKGYAYLVAVLVDWKESIGFLLSCFWRKTVEEAEAPGYHVPFELEDHNFVTVEKVWQCKGRLLRAGDQDHRMKDHCLSFALSIISLSRFVGYPIPREISRKSWKLFQKIILSKKNGYERAFRIIEVELAFSFNKLYTKYPLLNGLWVLNFVKLVFMIIGSCVVASTILHYQKPRENARLATVNGLSIDTLLTFGVIITVLILEILQILFMCFSKWGKVLWICNYVNKESWQNNRYMEKLIEVICHFPSLKPWERKLHQYSLLESYGHSPPWWLYNFVTAMFVDPISDGQKESTPSELSQDVKSAVIRSLVNNSTKLENGKASLRQNHMRKLLWACHLETQAQVIMVWHIATGMCEYQFPAVSNTDFLGNFKTATSLSKYLAYLVAFAPRLLPDHPFLTENVFDQVILEARAAFRGCNSLEDKVRQLINIGSQEQGVTVIDRGARLGKQLMEDVKNPGIVWKILADFWAEFMVYVAPSNDTAAHADHLTMGGEFITHIWALLSHSGIEREPYETPKLERSRSWS